MLFGPHVSIAGGIDKAPERSAELGGEVFQIFSRGPQGGTPPAIDNELIERLHSNLKTFKQKEFFIHAPYIINLASQEQRIVDNSVRIIKEEMERGSLLGAKYVMIHVGSAKEMETKEADTYAADNIKRILDKEFKTQLLLEISAGAGNVIGSTFESLAFFIKYLKDYPLGICLDTAHMFAGGYDLRNRVLVKKTFDTFDEIVGMKHLKMFHLNDSKVGLGEKKDRHEHIGDGHIGLKGFEALAEDKRLEKYSFILETQHDKVAKDIAIMKKFRDKNI